MSSSISKSGGYTTLYISCDYVVVISLSDEENIEGVPLVASSNPEGEGERKCACCLLL